MPRVPQNSAGRALGAAAAGALAAGAAAIGVLAIGRMAVGALAIGRARIGRLEIDELVIRRHSERRLRAASESRPPADPVPLDDLAVGQEFRSATALVTANQIKAFAASFDPQPFHLDEDAAAASMFGGLIASGWHTAALTMRLLATGGLPFAGGLMGKSSEISWPRPVYPGDTLRVDSVIVAIAPSRSRPDRATLTVRSTTRNQNEEPVQIMTSALVVTRRDPPPA